MDPCHILKKSEETTRGLRGRQEIQVPRVCESGGEPNVFPGQHEKLV